MPSQTLPEGTDTIINGAGADGRDDDIAGRSSSGIADTGTSLSTGPAGSTGDGGPAQTLRDQATAKAAEVKEQAGDKARAYVEQGRTRATEALENVSRMIGDAASTVDDKVGAEYGDYARRAQSSIDSFAASIRDKDVDELFADIREFVKRSPGVALGVATVAGFALVRLLRAGVPDTGATPSTGTGSAGTGSAGVTTSGTTTGTSRA